MGEEKVYLNSDASIEERVEDLLSRMSLEEKVAQLKARMLHIWRIFSKLLEGLPEDQRKRLGSLFFKIVFEERDLLEPLSVNYWRKHWKEIVIEGKECAVGELSCALRPFSPKEGAEFANEMQKFVREKRGYL